MPYQYGEIFERLGVPGMGHQGAAWCALNSAGVMILMSHQNYFHRRNGNWIYESPPDDPMPPRAPSAARSLRILAEYFVPGRDIILPVAVFVKDGGNQPDGSFESSIFRHATGDVYNAKFQAFNQANGHIYCEITDRFSV